MRERRRVVHSPEGRLRAPHPPATDDPSEIGPVDFVFLGLKANSYATCGAAARAAAATTTTAVIAAQNGIPWWYFHGLDGPHEDRRIETVDPDGAVTAVMPPERAIGCVVYASTELEKPGVVRHYEGTRFAIGEPDRDDLGPLHGVQRRDDRGRAQVSTSRRTCATRSGSS